MSYCLFIYPIRIFLTVSANFSFFYLYFLSKLKGINTQFYQSIDLKSISLINKSEMKNQLDLERESAVEVRNAYKSYKKGVPVLSNFEMTVPQGKIYSLIGSSGCGKTTILSCIAGVAKLDSGHVVVFGQTPGTPESRIPGRGIGYMQQGITLYTQLSIKETLKYFGRIYGMTESEISGRIEFLVKFLDIPSTSQRVGTLSSGQQRRTSLAVCLLHEPSLLILDEPTVGVDPLIRENIWNYLFDIVQRNQTTVIITTHYFEEAKNSHTVGFMRKGRLMEQRNPKDLLQEYNVVLLEEIMLQLCKQDDKMSLKDRQDSSESDLYQILFHSLKSKKVQNKENESVNCVNITGLTFKTNWDMEEEQKKSKENEVSFKERHQRIMHKNASSGSKMKAIFIRNILMVFRNPIRMYLGLFFPAFHLLVTNLFVGPEPRNLKFGIVNPEINFDLNICQNISTDCNLEYLSCKYLNIISSMIEPILMPSEDVALENIVSGRLLGYLVFPANYSQHLQDRFLANQFALEESITESTIHFRMDMSNYFTGRLLQNNLYKSYQTFLKNLVSACEYNSFRLDLPLKFNSVYGSLEGSFQDYISPAVLILLCFYTPCFATSITMLIDRNEGTLGRTMVAGASIKDIIIPFFLTEGLLILVQTAISYCVFTFIFQWDVKGSIFGVLTLIVVTGFGGVSLGFLIVQLIKEISEIIILTMGMFLINIYYTEILWSLQGTSLLVRSISCCFPLAWVTRAIRSMISRGWPLTHSHVWPGFASLFLSIIICWMLAVKLWKARI